MSFSTHSFRASGLVALLAAGTLAAAQPTAYVANRNSNSVSVINTGTNSVVATIPVGVNPQRVAISPDSTRVYVTNNGSDSVSVISAASNTVVATIPVGISPSWIAMAPDGRYAYVSDGLGAPYTSRQQSVSIIDTAANAVVKTIPIPRSHAESSLPGSNGLAITPDGRFLFVGGHDPEGAEIIMIETATNTIVSSIVYGSDGSFTTFISPDGTRLWTGLEDLATGGVIVRGLADIVGISDSLFGKGVPSRLYRPGAAA